MNLILLAALLLAQDYPVREGLVNDFAGELDQKTKAALHEKLVALREGGKGRMVVVTVKSLNGQSIEDYAHGLLKKWGIGTKEENDGILFIHAPAERKIRIETGYGMESRLPDITAKRILSTKVTPLLKAGKFNEALLAGVDAVAAEVSAPEPVPKEQAIKEQAVKVPSPGISPIGWMLMGLLCFAFFAIILWMSGVFSARASYSAPGDSRVPIMSITVAMAATAAAAAEAKRRAEATEGGIPNPSGMEGGMEGLVGLQGVAGLDGIQGLQGISGISMLQGLAGSPVPLVPPALETQFPSTHFKPATPKRRRSDSDSGSSYSSPSRSDDSSSSSSSSYGSSSDSSSGGGDSGGGGASDSY